VVDAVTCRARVTFADRGNMESHWLDVLQLNAGANQDYRLPDVGELVGVMMDEHDEAGCILGALYSKRLAPPSADGDVRMARFSDGAVFSYDRAAHVLAIDLGSGTAEIAAGALQLTSSVTVQGGAEAVALAQKTADALTALKDAISAAPIVALDGGAAFKAGIVAALAAWPPDIASESLSAD
jgi:phage baseplate assembly protein V